MKNKTKMKELQKINQLDHNSVNFFDPVQFDSIQRAAKLFANSELVPDMYKASAKNPLEKATANCVIALDLASRIQANPLMIMQNLIIIYGRPSWSSKFLIATVNTCGRFEPLKYRFENLGKVGKIEITEYQWDNATRRNRAIKTTFDGTNIDNIQCTAYTVAKGSDEALESSPISIEMAIREGWYSKNGSKWQTMPQQMLMYRAASFWTNVYAPEISMGMQTTEEIRDIVDIPFEEIEDEPKEPKKMSFEKPDKTPEAKKEDKPKASEGSGFKSTAKAKKDEAPEVKKEDDSGELFGKSGEANPDPY